MRHMELKKLARGFACTVWLAGAAASTLAQNNPPQAFDDNYTTGVDNNLSIDAPGMLENDIDPDGDALTPVLVDPPVSGGVANLFLTGEFEYEPPAGFIGTDSFTYQAFDGSALSNVATVTIEVTGTPGFTGFTDEAAFLAAVAALGMEVTVESYEDDAVWGVARTPFTASSVTSLGIRWTSNNSWSSVTTSSGPARTGSWGFYSLPHGSYATGVDCHLPGNCGDGWRATSSPTIYAAGGWIDAIFGSTIQMTVDGDRIVGFNDASAGSVQRFFGVVDPAGFHSFEILEMEGTAEDAKYLWVDDYTFATLPGITLSVVRATLVGDAMLQWLGGSAPFTVYASPSPIGLLSPGNAIGTTSGRLWADTPPPGTIVYYKVE